RQARAADSGQPAREQAAEAALFARGGNSGPYLTVLAAVTTTQMSILDQMQRQAERQASAIAHSDAATHVADSAPPFATDQPAAAPMSTHAPASALRPSPTQPHPAEKTHPTPASHPPHYRKASGARLVS
nr:hypothetical protein [Ktedonobacterales bacterium]